jgi:hypothetical protein
MPLKETVILKSLPVEGMWVALPEVEWQCPLVDVQTAPVEA